MARRFDRNNGGENVKLRNVMDNPQNEHITKDIFDILQTAHPNVQGEDVLIAEESAINEGAGTGLLQELNKRNGLDFGFFGHENFSIEELGILNLNKIPGLEVSDDMRAAIETAIVKAIKQEFSRGLDNDIARKFNDTVKYHNTTLAELLTSIDLFDRQLNGEEKGKYLKFKNNFVLTFFQIKNNLAPINDPTTNQNINENLDTKPFSEWTESQQKSFDYLFSKLVLGRLHSRVQWVDSVAENITNSFVLPLSLSMIPKSQQFNIGENGYESLREYAKDNLPELYEELTSATEENIEEVYWKIYLNKIAAVDSEIADVLGYLYEKNFDTACLNDDVAKRNAFLSKLAELRYKELESSGAIEAFGNDKEQFKRFFMDLFDFSKNEVTINGVTLHIDKELGSSGAMSSFKDLSEFLNAKDLPLKFSIKGVEGLNLSVEDQQLFNKLFEGDFVESIEAGQNGAPSVNHKDVVLKDSKVGKLLILYLMGKPSVIESYDPSSEQGKKIDNFFKSLDKEISIDKNNRELNEEEKQDNEDPENPDDEENGEEDGEMSEKKEILSLWNNIKGDEAAEGVDSFGPGAILYWPFGESVLPPRNGSAKDWMKLCIKDVDWNRGVIKMRSNGLELELPGNYEDKEVEMPLSVFKKRFLDKGPDIGGEPFKILSSEKDFEKAFHKYTDEKLCLESLLGDAYFKDGKLMIRNRGMDGKEHDEEVKYFSSGLGVSDKAVYKVDWNGDGTVTVRSSSFMDGDDSFDYKRKMSYPDFLIFASEKNLSPRTERMAEDEKTKIKDIVSHRTSKLKWVSIGSLIYSFKSIMKSLNEGMANYQKKQNEECLNLIVGKGIFDKINKWFGWASPALADAALQAQDKAEKGMDKGVWEGIEAWLKEFSSMGDFANFFTKGEDAPSGQRLRMLDKILKANGFKTLKDVVSSGTFVGENDELRPIIAAAMIANIKKGAGLYRSIAEQDNQCLWIRCLFGPDHYRRYLEMRRQLENDIKEAELSGDSAKAKQLSDLLVQSETTYIINCIENSHGKDKYFGAPSDNNVQALKLMYSNEFASQLSSAVEEGIGESAVDKGYSGAKKYNLFDPAFKEFEKNIASGRIDRGIGNIERLGEVAVNDSDFVNLNVAMTYVTLTGILNRKEGKSVRTRFDGMARAYMLPTAFFGEKNENQRNAWYILDKCGCGFTEFMASKGLFMEQFTASSDNVPYKELYGALQEWWTAHASEIDAYFESLKTNEQTDPILKKVSKILWETNPDSISPKWRSKPKITGHYALLASPESIRQNKGYDRDGFSGDTDERNDKAAFWESLLKSLNRAKNTGTPKFFLNEFKLLFNYEGFGTGNDEENNMMIQMIKEVKERAGQSIVFEIPEGGSTIELPSSTSYSPDDYKHLIRYMFEGRVLSYGKSAPPKQVKEVLDFFVKYFTEHFDEISGNEALLKEIFPVRENLPVRKLVPWGEYQDVIQGDSNYFAYLPDSEEGDIDSKNEKEQRKAMKRKKQKHYRRGDEFYNDEFISLQRSLKRLGISAKSLAEIAGEKGVKIK